DPNTVRDPAEVVSILCDEAAAGAHTLFKVVFENGPRIKLDHHLVYHVRPSGKIKYLAQLIVK
ncbi:hypothetical protein DFH07DRAFT_728240, partial [Mycena maculata]